MSAATALAKEKQMHDLDRAMFETEEAGGEQEEAQDFRERDVELAAQLLEVRTEAELDQLIGGLLQRVGGVTRKFARSGTGRALGGILQQAAKRVLPQIGTAPALGLELEGLSPEDREFEMARAFVRFADAAARHAARAPSASRPTDTAAGAAIAAARRHLPGLLAPPRTDEPSTDRQGSDAMTGYQTQEWDYLEMEGDELENEEWESESDEQEAELVDQLLEVTSEEELDQFLGDVFRKAAKAVGGVIKSPVGRVLAGTLKNVARRALPVAAGALGNFVLPGVGGAIGSRLGSMAGQMFEMELESMDEQEAEYEVARRYVRLASTAAKQAARAPRSTPPNAVAKGALITAAKRHAPGLLRGTPAGRRGKPRRRRAAPVASGIFVEGGQSDGCANCAGEPHDADDRVDSVMADADNGDGELDGAQTGQWIRRGRKIVIMGA